MEIVNHLQRRMQRMGKMKKVKMGKNHHQKEVKEAIKKDNL